MTDGKPNLNLMTNKGESENAKKKDWSILLPELLQLIMSLLIVKDSIRASVVCKGWYKASASIRMKDRHLWLMRYPYSSKQEPCELYDHLQDKTYMTEFPEMVGMTVYYSKDGWLLMGKCLSSKLSFFNPFSRTLICLPKCQNYNLCAAFTCTPTSTSCLVIGLTNTDYNNNHVAINTFRFGETKWNTNHFMSPEHYFATNSKIVFSEGMFYCLGKLGSLAVFDPYRQIWNIHHPKCSIPWTIKFYGTYLVENKGDIFLLNIVGDKLRVFKLCRDKDSIWEETGRIDEGLLIYGDFREAKCRYGIETNMRNKLLFSDSYHPEIVTYSFEKGMYIMSDSSIIPWDTKKTISRTVWIEPPRQSLHFE